MRQRFPLVDRQPIQGSAASGQIASPTSLGLGGLADQLARRQPERGTISGVSAPGDPSTQPWFGNRGGRPAWVDEQRGLNGVGRHRKPIGVPFNPPGQAGPEGRSVPPGLGGPRPTQPPMQQPMPNGGPPQLGPPQQMGPQMPVVDRGQIGMQPFPPRQMPQPSPQRPPFQPIVDRGQVGQQPLPNLPPRPAPQPAPAPQQGRGFNPPIRRGFYGQ